MKNLIAGLVLSALVATGSAASAECYTCEGCGPKINVNGKPFMGKWAMIDDRPYIGIESFSDALGIPRAHNFKGWSLAQNPDPNVNPFELATKVEDDMVPTVRFGGVTMIDLMAASNALDMPFHHNFRNRTFQVGSNYTGEEIKGAWYSYLSQARGWTSDQWGTIGQEYMDKKKYRGRRNGHTPRGKSRI